MPIKDLLIKIGIKGDKKAQGALKKTEGSMKSLGSAAMKVGGVFFAAKGLISGFSSIIRLAGEQEQAEKKLEVALGKTSKALLDQASALQKVSTHGDEAIIAQQAFLASLKFSEDQIKTIIPVAIDLAAATGISLESAVRNTSKTFSGLAGELGELVPQLRDLTQEEMRAGEAVKVLGELFEGQAAEQAGTMAFALNQAEMASGDLAEAIGERLSPLTKVLAENFTDVVEQLTALVTQKDIEFIGPIFSEADSALLDFRESLKEMSLEQLIFEMESANGLLKNMSSEADAFDLLTAKSNAASYEVAALTQNIKKSDEAEIQLGTTIERVNTAHIDYLLNAGKLKKEQLAQDLRSAALSGQSAMESMKSVVRAESMKHVAKLITSIFSNPAIIYPFNLVLAAGAGGVVAGLMDKALGAIPNKFATGADFVTSGATPMLVGESGPERVSVTPLTPGMNQNGPQGGITLNISGGLIDDSYVRNELIPALNKATSMGSGLA